jgi:predicted nucleotidyltransferase
VDIDTLGLGEKERFQLRHILDVCRAHGVLYAFGSRARGRGSRFSDLDILVRGKDSIPLAVLASLECEISESVLPFKLDIIDAARASPTFLAAIEPDLVPIADPARVP